ncbi:GreA/GreB family elongation factor [Sphingomonas sp. RP10(2022)]|uniref:GreA/GreB family elongation factor n=1 Tax=Sphingomonas liriopis TaxID=2949094 RepID=A0A9X2HWE2_9SPHN|nr:GreA/GreB family elongation factor [Sphingomonas liriopis]MCP3734778.1 GreA/GreB family elongation factor [Sphingomonas liriopis]
MSVAFRRESDEEHLEPKFERPIPAGPNLVTRAGKALIEQEIATLEATLADASADGMEAIRRDLRYWQTRRTTAVETVAPADGSAGFGTAVTVRMGGRTRTIAIVGDDEADPNADRLAFGAPLARVLAGADVGDLLPFAGRDDAIEVLEIAPLAD